MYFTISAQHTHTHREKERKRECPSFGFLISNHINYKCLWNLVKKSFQNAYRKTTFEVHGLLFIPLANIRIHRSRTSGLLGEKHACTHTHTHTHTRACHMCWKKTTACMCLSQQASNFSIAPGQRSKYALIRSLYGTNPPSWPRDNRKGDMGKLSPSLNCLKSGSGLFN